MLRDRLDEGWMILDRQTKTRRQAHAGDVAFLFRAMTDVWPYESALAEVGLDYLTVGGSAFYVQQEVRDVVNVLSAIEDPLDAVALAGALRSPFFSLSDDGLYWLARFPHGGLTEGIRQADQIDGLSDRDRRAAKRSNDLLAHWRELKDHVPLARLVARVLDESGYEAALVCEFLGSRKLANTRKLVRLAHDFDRQESFTLADFVARLRADLQNPPREEQAATSDEDSPTVRLMSIHQAKGLEFPIVVVPDLNRKSSGRDDLVSMHSDLGLVIRPPQASARAPEDGAEGESGQSVGWLAFSAIEDDEDRNEAIRLFYVATTRARDYLILSAGMENSTEAEGDQPSSGARDTLAPSSPKASSPAFQLLMERFEWRTGSCLAELPEGWPVPRVDVILATPADPEATRPRQSIRRKLELIEQAISHATVDPPRVPSPPAPLPAWVDLDSEPETETPSRKARLGRLIRAALVDRGLLGGEPLDEVCARLGSRQVPAASSQLVATACDWLKTWSGTALFEEIRTSSRARKALVRDVRWSLPWPIEAPDSSRVRGHCDVIYRDQRGRWRPVIVSPIGDDLETGHLRLMFASILLPRLGYSPVGPGWWVRSGADGRLLVDVHVNFNPEALDKDLGQWVEQKRDTCPRIPRGSGQGEPSSVPLK